MSEKSPDQRRIEGNEARQVLESKHFKRAFDAVGDYLEEQALACDPDNRDKTQRIVISKQLLRAIKRELERKMDDGYVAEVEISELERKRGLFRFVR